MARGSNGTKDRLTLRPDAFSAWARELAAIEAGIPEETQQELVPYAIETGRRYLLMGDEHLPEHDRRAIELAVDFAKKQGCDALLHGGDTSEHASTSQWEKDPSLPRFREELYLRTAYTKFLRPQFKVIVEKMGNHEDNLRRFVQRRAPEIADLTSLNLEELLQFDNMGIEWVASDRSIKAGKMTVVHGHEFRSQMNDPANPARWLFTKAHSCAACFHYHRSSAHRERGLNGFENVTWTVGCLRKRTPSFRPINNWNWGFAILDLEDSGDFEFRNFCILGGYKIVPA